MKVAVVGCGKMGVTYIQALTRMPGVELTAISDLRQEQAERIAAEYGTSAYSSVDDLLADNNIQVVCVTVPSHFHKELVLKAAKAGKHIICEKPLALSPKDAEEMIQSCNENGVRLYVAHVVRFFPAYADIKRKVSDGVIGEVGIAHAKRIAGNPGEGREWFLDPRLSGGVILDVIIHDIDFMRWTLGEISSVYALNHRTESMDYAFVTLRFRSGAIANLEGCLGSPDTFTSEVELFGKKGAIRHSNRDGITLRTVLREGPHGSPVVNEQSPIVHSNYWTELNHFLECIRTGNDPVVSAYDGLKAVEIAAAAIESIRTGQPVSLPES
ncbi:Gfo/Idh/MocA family oxidoreductase [Paenibacillus filicis]|uniref:Gfo/Idh/MocA family oxidoreductase n=1 Tax=Paenibacillus gyeongsangnamensis TaxID=3388067 RepID=A0ABT4QHJ2_9BACL|nr:Gfo/Idh/MocA family oxidoreductase [Paenibacillus filicis]MCZ8516262.1 Gfo/Idh/MocA family oxidoreductase [Paenibacillus filicis]